MPITPRRGHWYERVDAKIVAYEHRNHSGLCDTYPHTVGGLDYSKDGRYIIDANTSLDLEKDLGTSDPRLKKPARKPAEKPAKVQPKKFRKVRMYFYRHGRNNVSATDMPGVAATLHRPGASPIFDLVIDVPVYPSVKNQALTKKGQK